MLEAQDRHQSLGDIDNYPTLSEKIAYIHSIARSRFGAVDRVAIAKYDAGSDKLCTYVSSTEGENPLVLHEAFLAEVPSLKNLVENHETRVIDDLGTLAGLTSLHSRRIVGSGFGSSYTVPLFHDNHLIGILFFNSYHVGAFDKYNLTYLDLLAQLISSLLATELNQIATLRGAIKTATQFTSHRDPETGMHLERMAHYSRLIARQLANTYPITDEFVEDIFRYAPLHDVGKITIPDCILLKPGPLTPNEREIMKTHACEGRKMIDAMLRNFQFEGIKNIGMIHNIVAHHHEMIDGSGYPDGLSGQAIPLEARIVAVADVFDALTTERPYKKPWSNARACAELERLSAGKLDPDCVAALLRSPQEIEEIQRSFAD